MPPPRSSASFGPLETVRCDLCGSNNDRTIANLTDVMMETTDQVFRLAQCRQCDLIYLNPRPQPERMHLYYPESYQPFARKGLSSHARLWLYRREVRELERVLAAPNRVVDVGCGNGDLLDAVRSVGNANVLGIEPAPGVANAVRERKRLPVYDGTLEQARLPDQSVDTVLLSHVLEHLPSPGKTLAEVARILKPGGCVVVWVPNARSLAARTLGKHWMGWDAPRHLYSFTPATLHVFFRRAGLIPVDIKHETHGLEWAWGLRLAVRARAGNTPLNRLVERLHPLSSAALTPLGIISAVFGRSGRIRMIARNPCDLG